PALTLPQDWAYHWPMVATRTCATILRHFFPTSAPANLAAISALEADITRQVRPHVPPGIVARSVRRGQAVAEHILGWAQTDGGHAAYLTNFPPSYRPPRGPGLWE